MPVKRLTAVVAFCLLGLVITGVACWGTLAILLTGVQDALRLALAGGFALCSLAAVLSLFSRRWRRAALLVYLLPLGGLLLWWQTLEPSNERD